MTAKPGRGHNSGAAIDKMPDVGGIAADRLRSFVERIERLEEEKAATAQDIKEVYAEAKGSGFDAKTIRRIVALRKVEEHVRQESTELLNLYARALGMQLRLEV